MIVETSSNQFFRVKDAGNGISHAWLGIEVKRVKGAWVPKAKAREQLVRKLGSRINHLETRAEVDAFYEARRVACETIAKASA
jgi:hypothetical protein